MTFLDLWQVMLFSMKKRNWFVVSWTKKIYNKFWANNYFLFLNIIFYKQKTSLIRVQGYPKSITKFKSNTMKTCVWVNPPIGRKKKQGSLFLLFLWLNQDHDVLVSVAQLVGIIHNICKVRGSNSDTTA